jgi:hypothetical protein
MRRIQIVLPTVALLLSGGAALAATGTGGTQAAGGKFSTESEAAKSCGAGNVVWANTSTKVFHVQGDQYYGHTKRGAFMCKSTATADGFHQSGQTAHKG